MNDKAATARVEIRGDEQLMTSVGALLPGKVYELPRHIAEDLVKTRGCKLLKGGTDGPQSATRVLPKVRRAERGSRLSSLF